MASNIWIPLPPNTLKGALTASTIVLKSPLGDLGVNFPWIFPQSVYLCNPFLEMPSTEFAGLKWIGGEKFERIPDSIRGFKDWDTSI
jgi:hypothetical protein